MTVLVIEFKGRFMPTENEFYKTKRVFCSSQENIQKNPSGFTKVSYIRSIQRIFKVYFSRILKFTVWVIDFKIRSWGAGGESEKMNTWVLMERGKSK